MPEKTSTISDIDIQYVPFLEVLHHFSHVSLFATLWTIASQAPLSLGFSRQDYWSGLPFPSPGDLPNPGIKPTSLISPALAGGFFITRVIWTGSSKSLGKDRCRSRCLGSGLPPLPRTKLRNGEWFAKSEWFRLPPSQDGTWRKVGMTSPFTSDTLRSWDQGQAIW